MTQSVIHYWCLPQPGWWIIKPLIRPGNSASSSADDTHLHKSHAAIFHTLAQKHKHTPTCRRTHKVHRFWLALWCARLTLFYFFKAFPKAHNSVVPGRNKFARDTDARTVRDKHSTAAAPREERQYVPHPPDFTVHWFPPTRWQECFAYVIQTIARLSETGEGGEKKMRQKAADLTEFVFTSCLWVLWQRKSRES